MEGDFKTTIEEISLDSVKKRAVSGVILLTFRTILLQIISFVGFYVLLPLFVTDIADYGIFFILSSVINFLSYFSDIGLAAALIQKKESLSDKDLKTTFTVQQILVFSAVILVFVLTPIIKSWQHLDQASVFLLWSLALAFLFSSLKTIPSILLERKLEFQKLIIPQIVETLLFNTTVVYLAYLGWGIMAFIPAVLLRGLSGLILMYILQPWTPGLAFDKNVLKQLLKFGAPYQASTFLAIFKDDGITLIIGGILGAEAVALLGLAKRWAEAPLRFFMDQVIKVTFPAYSRMQDHKEELSGAVTRSIFFVSFLCFPFIIGLGLMIPLLIDLVPRYAQWREAILLFMIFGINTFWAAVTTPLTSLLDALGKVKVRFNLMVMWTVLSWLVIPFLAYFYGLVGAAIGYAIVGSSSFVAIIITRKIVKFDLVTSTFKPLIAAVGMGVVVYLVRGLMPPSFAWVVTLIVFGGLVYILGIFYLIGPVLLADLRKVFNAISGKK